MSGTWADYLENEIQDQIWGALAWTAPATYYIALSIANPLDDNSGLSEPSGGSYARKDITNNKTTFTVSSGGAVSNAIEIVFVEATGDWGTISHFVIMDALTVGNPIAHGDFTTAKAITSGDTARIPIGDLDLSVD